MADSRKNSPNSSKPKEKKLKKKVNRDVAKALKKDSMGGKFLLGMNPYLETLLDPFNKHGVRIPDMVTYPSAPFTIVYRKQVTVNAQGLAFLAVGLAYDPVVPVATYEGYPSKVGTFDHLRRGPELSPVFSKPPRMSSSNNAGRICPINLDSADGAYLFGCISSSSSVSTDLFNAALSVVLDQWNASNQAVQDSFTKVRLVSAGLTAEYQGAALNAKGVFTGCSIPKAYDTDLGWNANATTVDTLAAVPGAVRTVVPKQRGITVLYKPVDLSSLNYVDIDKACSFDSIDNTVEDSNYGALIIACSGANPTDIVDFTCVLNYEGIPEKNTLNFEASATSKSDPVALSSAFNVVADSPSAVPIAQPGISNSLNTPSLSSSSSATMHTDSKSEPSMIEKVISGVSGVIDTGKKIYDKVSPLIEAALPFI